MTNSSPVVVVKKHKSTRTLTPTSAMKPKPVAKPQPTAAEQAAKQAAHQEKNRAEQKVAKLKRYEAGRQMLDVLSQKWPAIFSADAPTMPLKIHIDQDVIAALAPEYTRTKIRRAFGLYFYLVRFRYQKVLAAGGPRFDLDGQECGMVTEEEQARARVELVEMKGKGKG